MDQLFILQTSQKYILNLQESAIQKVLNDQKLQENVNHSNKNQLDKLSHSQQNQTLENEDNSNVLMDFSNMFKKPLKRKKKPVQNRFQQYKNGQNKSENLENQENIDIQNTEVDNSENQQKKSQYNEKQVIIAESCPIIDNEIPRNLTITQEEMKERRFLDQRRWFCLSRCQYKRSCGISSLVSVWNYLFSTLGTGDLPPISQEEALIKLGVCKEKDKYFGDIEFGAFTGNSTLIKWFRLLCKIYNVQGRAFIMWKHSGEGKTAAVDQELALEKLKDGLKSENNGFIYHAQDHYFCPMGFELTTQRPMDAYKKMEDINQSEIEPWIFIGEPSKCYPCFHIKKWKDIVKDLTMGNPYYYNIRRPDKGVMERKGKIFQQGGKKFGTTINCLIQFQKVIKIEKKTAFVSQDQALNQEISQQNYDGIGNQILQENQNN